jgi:hypothetical protein
MSKAPAINDRGTIVFRAFFDNSAGIFTRSRLLVASGDTIDSVPLQDVGAPALNDEGRLVFNGRAPSWHDIFTRSGVVGGAGSTIDGKTLLSAAFPAINNAGTIVFPACFSNGSGGPVSAGLFTRSRLVVRNGAAVGGKTISVINPPQINDRGTIAFQALFTDGTSGIVVAIPDDD